MAGKPTHGLSGSRIYKIWVKMKQRCTNPNYEHFHHYGGRGIVVCDEWFSNFESFYHWSINNGYEDNLELDRVEVNGNYEPGNCRWISHQLQLNNKRNNAYIVVEGVKLTVTQAAEKYSISKKTLWNRLFRSKWPVEKSIFELVK